MRNSHIAFFDWGFPRRRVFACIQLKLQMLDLFLKLFDEKFLIVLFFTEGCNLMYEFVIGLLLGLKIHLESVAEGMLVFEATKNEEMVTLEGIVHSPC